MKVYLDIETYTKGDKPTLNDKVIAIGIMNEIGNPELLTEWEYGSEKRVIREFYKRLSKYTMIIGFNILKFDIPILSFKATKYKIRNANNVFKLWHGPLTIDYHQVSLTLSGMRFKGLSLAYLADLLREKGISDVPERVSGKAIKKLYKNREYEKIERHLRKDLEITRLVDLNWKKLFGHE